MSEASRVLSTQVYEREGRKLACLPPSKRPLDLASPSSSYTRRVRIAGEAQVHLVSLPAGTAKPMSSRDDAIVVLLISGSMQTDIAGGPSHLCEPASLTYHPPGETGTGVVGRQGAVMMVASIGAERSAELVDLGMAERSWRELTGHREALRLLHEFSMNDPESDLAVSELSLGLLASSKEATCGPGPLPRWWKRLQEMIQEASLSDWSLSQIAGDLGVHPTHLCSAFRSRAGCTLGEAIRRRKVMEAAARVISTSQPLGEIALDHGFSDQSHFIRIFKRVLGVLPSDLRSSSKAAAVDAVLERKVRIKD